MTERRDRNEETELERLLRRFAGGGMLLFLLLITVAAVFGPVFFPSAPWDTTLLLGLAGSFTGALLMLAGLSYWGDRWKR